MLSVLIFILVLSSGGFLSAAFFRKSFGEVLPVTCVSLILCLFVFGVIGHLLSGVYFVLILAFLFYLISMIKLIHQIQNSGFKSAMSCFISRFCSMGFIAFAVFIFVDFYCNTGRLVIGWDDFSHWATTVKQMTMIDQLSVSPEAEFVFYKSYPPATSLFLYFPQKTMFLLDPMAEFSEWRLFFAQHLLMIAFVTPFCDRLKYRNYSSYVMILVFYTVPFLWSSDAYSAMQVDFLLGLVFGAGLASLLLTDPFTSGSDFPQSSVAVFPLACISFLVLLKASGMLLAVLLSFAMILMTVMRNKNRRHVFHQSIPVFLALFIPELLWNYALKSNGVYNASGLALNAGNAGTLWSVLTGADTTFRSEVFSSFMNQLAKGTAVEVCGISLNYGVFALITVLAFIFLARGRILSGRNSAGECLLTGIISCFAVLASVFGLLLLYLFYFSETESLGLASFHRYIGMGFNAAGYLVLFLLADFLSNKLTGKFPFRFLVCIILVAMLPFSHIKDSLTRKDVYESYIFRSDINALCEKVSEYTDDNSSVYLVHQGSHGYSYWMSRFVLMPVKVNPLGNTAVATWSFSDEEDRLSRVISPEDWQKELKETCDYVILYIIDDYFREKYMSLFEDPESILMNGIYQVDKDTGRLSLLCFLNL